MQFWLNRWRKKSCKSWIFDDICNMCLCFSTSYARLKKWEHLQNIQQLTVTRNDFGHVDEWKWYRTNWKWIALQIVQVTRNMGTHIKKYTQKKTWVTSKNMGHQPHQQPNVHHHLSLGSGSTEPLKNPLSHLSILVGWTRCPNPIG